LLLRVYLTFTTPPGTTRISNLTLEITIFGLKMMVKSGLEKIMMVKSGLEKMF